MAWTDRPRVRYGDTAVCVGRNAALLASMGLSCGLLWGLGLPHALSYEARPGAPAASPEGGADDGKRASPTDHHARHFHRFHSVACGAGVGSFSNGHLFPCHW